MKDKMNDDICVWAAHGLSISAACYQVADLETRKKKRVEELHSHWICLWIWTRIRFALSLAFCHPFHGFQYIFLQRVVPQLTLLHHSLLICRPWNGLGEKPCYAFNARGFAGFSSTSGSAACAASPLAIDVSPVKRAGRKPCYVFNARCFACAGAENPVRKLVCPCQVGRKGVK